MDRSATVGVSVILLSTVTAFLFYEFRDFRSLIGNPLLSVIRPVESIVTLPGLVVIAAAFSAILAYQCFGGEHSRTRFPTLEKVIYLSVASIGLSALFLVFISFTTGNYLLAFGETENFPLIGIVDFTVRYAGVEMWIHLFIFANILSILAIIFIPKNIYN